MKILTILPTYNEAGNITRILKELSSNFPQIDILHIDDNSPDGTAEIALEFGLENYRQIRNFNKLGLGTAYKQGFKWALERGYELVITMDSDGSHHVSEITRLMAGIDGFDLVVGARWIPGGTVANWPLYRRIISRFGTWYAKKALKLPFSDLTSGFRIYRTSALEKIDFDQIEGKGYVFQIQMVETIAKLGAKINEVPITFTERINGKSKMSGKIAVEAFGWLTRRYLSRRAFTRNK